MSRVMTRKRTIVAYATQMDKLPETCTECSLGERICGLCSTKDGSKYLKAYTKKRHKDCPLIITEVMLR